MSDHSIQPKKKKALVCDSCKSKRCRKDHDCYGIAHQILSEYTGEALTLAQASSRIEGQYYMQKTRLEEVILFAHEMGYKKLGVAFCIGLAQEAQILCRFLRKEFDVVSVCCKVCGIEKDVLDLEKIDPKKTETMCNPIGQAALLNHAKTDLNLICGLCIGHDIQFTQNSRAPVTTFIVKDRVLGHNPAVSLYCRYLRKRIDKDEV
jgi:uncharacterized metal-binding protein